MKAYKVTSGASTIFSSDGAFIDNYFLWGVHDWYYRKKKLNWKKAKQKQINRWKIKQTVQLSGILTGRYHRFTNSAIHLFSTNVPLLCSLKKSEKTRFSIFSGGVYKWNISLKWISFPKFSCFWKERIIKFTKYADF